MDQIPSSSNSETMRLILEAESKSDQSVIILDYPEQQQQAVKESPRNIFEEIKQVE
jgi:hypothetical protein